uniref:Pre-mRNA splicing Prp18-interacting factor n=1 Tax=Tanacetum cinerariifolium TaxID=118510 RepID=A0A6L2JQ64_TANCI|nr:hypothetical protein [Tanacetum cinerariifolium]
MSSYNHFGCSCCGGPFNGENCPGCSSVVSKNKFVYDPNMNSFDNPPDFSYQSPQPQYEIYSCKLCGNDAHYGYDYPPQVPLVYEQEPSYNQDYDQLIKSSVENLVPNPSESEGLSEDLSNIDNSSIITSPKIDSLLDEFSGELAHINLIPPGINEADFDPKEEIQLLNNDSPSLPENLSFHFDIPSSPRPLAKPPDDDEIEPDTGVLTVKVVGDIS